MESLGYCKVGEDLRLLGQLVNLLGESPRPTVFGQRASEGASLDQPQVCHFANEPSDDGFWDMVHLVQLVGAMTHRVLWPYRLGHWVQQPVPLLDDLVGQLEHFLLGV